METLKIIIENILPFIFGFILWIITMNIIIEDDDGPYFS